MPRLNYGTLLENIVVLESVRFCLEQLTGDEALAFASAFAMPPLTQCWSKLKEAGSSPWFNETFLQRLTEREHPSGSIQQMWSVCVKNSPNLPVASFHYGDQSLLYTSAGPNGALLAAMLAAQRAQPIHLWINDNAERYGRIPPVQPGEEAPPDTIAQAGLLVGARVAGTASDVIDWFPNTIPQLADWLGQGAGRDATFRLGFLDPDNYAEGQAQVSPRDHRHWLRVLAVGRVNVLSVIFSGCQNRGEGNAARNKRLASFHADEVALYPQSLVFEYGNFQTGLKIRWPDSSNCDAVTDLRRRIEEAWRGWSASLAALTVHLNGQAAIE